MENPETGAVQDSNAQTGQPAQATPSLDQPVQPTLESLYQLSEQDRNTLLALPPEVRDPAVAALEKARVDQERGFQERLERGRQFEENYNTIVQSPEFGEFMENRVRQQPPQDNVNQGTRPGNVPQTGNLSAEDAERAKIIEDIAVRSAEIVEKSMGGINETLQNLQRGFTQTQRDRDWGTLVTWAKDNNYPEPAAQRSRIDLMMQRNPELTLDQAYRATLDLATLPTRPPVTQPNSPDVPVPSNEPPGQNRSSVVPRTQTVKKGFDDVAKEAYDKRIAGTDVTVEKAMREGIPQAVAEYNAEHGTNYTVDDLPR